MNINYWALAIIMLINLQLLIYIFVLKNKPLDKAILVLSLFCPLMFSGLGIISKNYFDNIDYLPSFLLFNITIFIGIFLCIQRDTSNNMEISEGKNKLFEQNTIIFKLLGMICLAAQVSTLIYPDFRLIELFYLPDMKFDGAVFQNRIDTDSNNISWLMERIELITYPFFFIWLYTLRKKPLVFMFIYIFFNYIDVVKNQYISRSAIAVILIFVWFYLYEEKIINRNFLKLILVCFFVISLPASYIFFYQRIGVDVSFELSNYWFFARDLMISESYGQQFLDTSSSMSEQHSFWGLILSSILSPFFFLPDINFPVLSYAFTEKVIGVEYGGKDYYIMLPGAFGEGLMIFGKNFAWIYGIFIGLFAGYFYRKLSYYPFLKFWLIYFVLDYARAFRGGIQTFVIATMNSLILLVIILLLLKFLQRRKTDEIIVCNTQYENRRCTEISVKPSK